MISFKKFIWEALSRKTPTEKEIAKKHKMSVAKVEAEIEKGEKVEKEHTKNDDTAEEIARDHIGEFPGYYPALKKMEKKLKAGLSEMAAADFNVKNVNGVYRAYDKKTRKSAAGAIPNKEPDGKGGEHDSIYKMATSPEWRGKGAMTAIHQHIEKEIGRPLHPSKALTDDGFNFWKKYRPDAVKDDLRHHRDHLMGKQVETQHGPGTITSVGSGVAVATLHKDNWSTSFVSKKDLIKQGHLKD